MRLHTSRMLLVIFLASLPSVADADSYMNVYGNELQACSQEGMALSGYTRTGYCVDEDDDQGSHHICIDVSTNTGGDFCSVTGQSDWCSSEMPCHDNKEEYCQVQNWCVCQWAFASYIQSAGGCDQIQEIVCESINLEAVKAYKKKQSYEKYADALSCLVDRCGLDLSDTSFFGSAIYWGSGNSSVTMIVVAATVIGVGLAGFFWHRRQYGGSEAKHKERLILPMDSNLNFI